MINIRIIKMYLINFQTIFASIYCIFLWRYIYLIVTFLRALYHV